MNAQEVLCRPYCLVKLTKQEIDLLMMCSQFHYDGLCKAASKPGINGFVYGMKNRMENDPDAVHELDFHKLDVMSKILEAPFPNKDSETTRNLLRDIQKIIHTIQSFGRIWRHPTA